MFTSHPQCTVHSDLLSVPCKKNIHRTKNAVLTKPQLKQHIICLRIWCYSLHNLRSGWCISDTASLSDSMSLAWIFMMRSNYVFYILLNGELLSEDEWRRSTQQPGCHWRTKQSGHPDSPYKQYAQKIVIELTISQTLCSVHLNCKQFACSSVKIT